MQKGGWGTGKFLVTGFPKNRENYEAWKKIMGDDIDVKVTLSFECSMQTMEKRMTASSPTKKGKANPEDLKKKFNLYQSDTKSLLEALSAKGKVQKINAENNVEVVYEDTKKILDQHFKKQVNFFLSSLVS